MSLHFRSLCKLRKLYTNYTYSPTGAITAIQDGSVTINGNASFIDNIADENGGKNLSRFRIFSAWFVVALDELDACALGFELQLRLSKARANIVNNIGGWRIDFTIKYITPSSQRHLSVA